MDCSISVLDSQSLTKRACYPVDLCHSSGCPTSKSILLILLLDVSQAESGRGLGVHLRVSSTFHCRGARRSRHWRALLDYSQVLRCRVGIRVALGLRCGGGLRCRVLHSVGTIGVNGRFIRWAASMLHLRDARYERWIRVRQSTSFIVDAQWRTHDID